MDLGNLTTTYRAQVDEQLLQLAQAWPDLTLDAQTALRSELIRRGLAVPDPTAASYLHANHETSGMVALQNSAIHSAVETGKFIENVWRLYRRYLPFFITLMAPATFLGALVFLSTRYEVREIMQHLPRGLGTFEHRTALIKIASLKWSGYLLTWIASCLCFAAVSAGVELVESGHEPSIGECLEALGGQIGRLLRLAILLFVLLLVIESVAMLICEAIYWLILLPYFGYVGRILLWALTYATWAAGLLILSRFGLAVPALVLDDYPVGKAMFLSDELTRRKWPILAVLVFKAVAGGYLAAWIPFWLARWIPNDVALPSWFSWLLWIISLAAVTFVEPVTFVGLGLLYLNTTSATSIAEASSVAV